MNITGNSMNAAATAAQMAINSIPESMSGSLLKNVGDQMVHDIASKLTNLLFSGGGNGSSNTFMQPQQSGGASMGNTLAMSNLQQMLQQVMQQMGINGQNSPFSPQSATGDSMNAFHGGLCSGLQAPAMSGTSARLPASISGNNASSSYNQLGNTMGSQLANKMGLQALDNVTADTGGLSFNGSGKVDGGTADSRAQIGKFMDQHPEIYGKPQGDGSSSGKIADAGKSPSSWEDALKDSQPLSADSLKAFQSAKNDLKTSMVGGQIQGNGGAPGDGSSSLLMNADAQLFNSNIMQGALSEHSKVFQKLSTLV
jgi:hypothetical protein